jgi:uncharacterized protein (DUF58 family)
VDDILQEILQRVRRLELRQRGRVREQLAGQYHASFRGQGIDFAEHRAYLPGDETRNIDWNVTARLQDPFIRTFIEERELLVYLLVDISPSMDFGSVPAENKPATARLNKRALAAEVAATIAFSALRNNDKVGLVLFSKDVDLMLPAARGRSHVLRVLREILARKGESGGEGATAALDALRKAVPRRALVFLISDMIGPDFSETLRPVARKHDLTAVLVRDPAEDDLPDLGLLAVEDPEDESRSYLLDTSKPQTRAALAVAARRWREDVEARFKKAGCPLLVAGTDADFTPALHALLRRRAKHPR